MKKRLQMTFHLDINNPAILAAAAALAQAGAKQQKASITEEAKDRKAVNAAIDAFWKKAPLATRRAFLAQLEGFAHERNVARIQRFATNLTEVPQAPAPAAATAAANPATGKDQRD